MLWNYSLTEEALEKIQAEIAENEQQPATAST